MSRVYTELQQRVLGALDHDYVAVMTVAKRCRWGKPGCSRSIPQLRRVVADLLRYGVIEANDQNRLRLKEDSHALASHDHEVDEAQRA